MPLVLVCGPWGSGTSAVAGMLSRAGLWAPGPYLRLKDARTENTYEMVLFRELLMRFVNEVTLERQMERKDIVHLLTEFRDDTLQKERLKAGIGGKAPLLLKHPLAVLLLSELREVFDLRVVCVVRPLEAIEKTRRRRNWHATAGERGARIIYSALFDYVVNSDVPFTVVRYSRILKEPEAVLEEFARFCGLTLTPSVRENAASFVRRPEQSGQAKSSSGHSLKYNICLVRPEGYIHSDAYLELAQLLSYTLQDMGFDTSLKYHKIISDRRNIILGCHMWKPSPASRAKIPPDSIIINTEQLYSRNVDFSSAWSDVVIEWAKHFETWDYSHKNIAAFREKGVEGVKHLTIGYHPKLTRIAPAQVEDIDVLFYGSMNDRRRQVLEELKKRGVSVHHVFGLYGKERDELVSRAKIVLNMHFYDAQIFEIVRVFYLMANRKAIVSEVNEATSIDPSLRAGVYSAPYEELVSSCIRLLESPDIRAGQAQQGFETIAKISQKEVLAPLLEGHTP